MEKCERRLNLEEDPRGSRDVRQWMYPAPLSVERHPVDIKETVYVCGVCGTRWTRVRTQNTDQSCWESMPESRSQ
jgi:hypothetical protein